MKEFISTLLQAVIVAAVPVCTTFLVKGIRALAKYFHTKADNDAANAYIDAIANAISVSVTYANQKYVDALKKSGEFSKENQKKAMEIALAEVKVQLTDEIMTFIEDTYGNATMYLEGRIEAEVRNQKNALLIP